MASGCANQEAATEAGRGGQGLEDYGVRPAGKARLSEETRKWPGESMRDGTGHVTKPAAVRVDKDVKALQGRDSKLRD